MNTKKINFLNRKAYIVLTAALATIFSACGEKKNKQDVEINTPPKVEQAKKQTGDIAEASFSDGMTSNVFQNYQQLRKALVKSDAQEVQTAAGNLAENISGEQKDMIVTALAMAETSDIERQRELFSEFTYKVEPMFKDSLTEGIIYKQFCPMAFDGKGGYWLSNLEEIQNPYYGDKMLKCGEVVEEIQIK